MRIQVKNRLPDQIEEVNSEFFKKNFDSAENRRLRLKIKNNSGKQSRNYFYAVGENHRNLLYTKAAETIIFIYFLNDY